MALIKCTECGKEFSEKASNCPHCGCPIEDVKSAMAEKEQIEQQKKAELEKIKEQKKIEKESKPKKELKPDQKKKIAIIGAIVAVVVILAASLGWYYGIKVPRDKAYATYSEVATNYNGSIEAYNQSVETYNTTAKEIIELNDTLNTAIQDAQAVIDSGETPYEGDKMTALSNTLKDTRNNIVPTPSLYENKESYALDESLLRTSAKKIEAVIETINGDMQSINGEKTVLDAESAKLEVPDYESTLGTIKTQQQELSESYQIQKQITNPTQDWVLSRLNNVENIANVACATEENDPNGHLGKDGGYTAQIYYSSPLLRTKTLAGDKLIDKGTDAGGSIEVYSTVEDAEQRNTYLGAFDGGIFDSGKHIVVGSMVVRVSTDLTASKQEQFINEIIAELTRVE